jgi:hypothetical protein
MDKFFRSIPMTNSLELWDQLKRQSKWKYGRSNPEGLRNEIVTEKLISFGFTDHMDVDKKWMKLAQLANEEGMDLCQYIDKLCADKLSLSISIIRPAPKKSSWMDTFRLPVGPVDNKTK